MRIVSLLPACTEWVAAFGGLEQLVGRSHACDYPPAVSGLPTVTRPSIDASDSGSIDKSIRQSVQEGVSPFEVDLDLLADLQPDVILTQTQCDVCAVSESRLLEGITELTHPAARIVSLHADTMKQVLSQALTIGQCIGRTAAAMQTIAALEKRLKMLRDRLGLERTTPLARLPSVALLEWLEPPMTAGHWTPDLIEMAGGRPACTTGGTRSRRLDWDDLLGEDPDVIALASCGLSLEGVRRDAHFVTSRRGWDDLSAVGAGRVYLFDGNAYFNRPGPRLYRSIELLAAAVYGDRAEIEGAPHEMARLEL